jgi:hypothetical protein
VQAEGVKQKEGVRQEEAVNFLAFTVGVFGPLILMIFRSYTMFVRVALRDKTGGFLVIMRDDHATRL